MKNVFIFLDFDGVLHKVNGKKFSNVDVFYHLIDSLMLNELNPQIIFSTSWREYSSLETLQNYFKEEYKNFFIDKTIVIKEDLKHPRYHEINHYIVNNNISNYIIIDDMDNLFPKNLVNLYITNEKTGITYEDTKNILSHIINNFKNHNKLKANI